jgi:tungstate transport system permease protein
MPTDMDNLLQPTHEAFHLLLTGDQSLWTIIGISFRVSLKAILFATPFALLIAFALAYIRFPGRRLVVSVFETLMALPAVVVGLLIYLLLSRSGPLGDLHLLFSQTAMVIGQIVLCLPVLVAMSHAAIRAADRRAWETSLTLGAGRLRAMLTLIHEVRFGLLVAVIAGFGRIISEIGTSMMVGGNIEGHTRNIPTAIALETSKGNFAEGIALGFVLVTLAFGLNLLLNLCQRREVHAA